MNYEILEKLFEEIQSITNLKDVAYHEIKDGKLNPIHKTSTDALGVEKWKNGHWSNPVHVKDTFVLQHIINTKEYVYIENTKEDSRSSEAFFFFGVDTNLIIPVIEEEKVKGIVCTVSIGKTHHLSQQQIDKCVELVNNYRLRL